MQEIRAIGAVSGAGAIVNSKLDLFFLCPPCVRQRIACDFKPREFAGHVSHLMPLGTLPMVQLGHTHKTTDWRMTINKSTMGLF